MPLQNRFFIIPISSISSTESELNAFLNTVKAINIQREFVTQGESSFWAVAVEYLTGDIQNESFGSQINRKPRIDYKEILSPEDFTIYSKLREWRKDTADSEGVRVYNILYNEHLAQIVENRVTSLSDLRRIKGVGEGKIKKYGEGILKVLSEEIQGFEEKKPNEASPKSLQPNTHP